MDWSQLLKNFAEAISPALQTLLNAVFLALATQASALLTVVMYEAALVAEETSTE